MLPETFEKKDRNSSKLSKTCSHAELCRHFLEIPEQDKLNRKENGNDVTEYYCPNLS